MIMNKKNLNVQQLNVVILNSHGEILESRKEVQPSEFVSCIDAGYWINNKPWLERTQWSNKSV